ncbi:hypothetical protein AVEN_176601-2-1, partial [Araneus ventricosus]
KIKLILTTIQTIQNKHRLIYHGANSITLKHPVSAKPISSDMAKGGLG